MTNLGVALFALAATTAGCTSLQAPISANDVALKEAAYRYLFENNASASRQEVSAYCVGGMDQATDTKVVNALSDVKPKVLSASSCASGDLAVVKATGHKALIFQVSNVVCESADLCSFQGGYYEANLSASSGYYLAERVNGHWIIRIDPKKPQAIS